MQTRKHLVVALVCVVACGSDPDSLPDGSGLDGGATDAGDEGGLCDPELIYPPDLLPECEGCGGGRCVAGNLLTSEQRDGLRDCSPTHECMPDEYLLAGPAFVPSSCTASYGAEGRCLSACLPGVFETRDVLAHDTCPATHRCVPCFDPYTGASTAACDAECDTGPSEPAVVLPACCEGRGACVSSDLIAPGARPYYAACESDEALCIPRRPDYVGPGCTAEAIAERNGEEYGPGVCAHECQAGVDALAPFLERDDCDEDFLCVPCRDPMTGEPSGACAS